jgi:hypothetical protein
MSKLRVLAIASLLFAGLSSSAYAAPVIVNYGLAPGGTATYNAGGVVGSGVAGGAMTVVYTSGAATLGGSLGNLGSLQNLVVYLTTPGTILANTVPAILVGAGPAVVRSLNFIGGATAVTYVPGQPGITWAGNMSGVLAGVAPNIGLNAAGTQQILGGLIAVNWTVGGIVGQEVSRTVVPEPTTGALLIMGLVGLAAYRVPRMRR